MTAEEIAEEILTTECDDFTQSLYSHEFLAYCVQRGMDANEDWHCDNDDYH